MPIYMSTEFYLNLPALGVGTLGGAGTLGRYLGDAISLSSHAYIHSMIAQQQVPG